MTEYTIGIDLGTTNCTMAFTKGDGNIEQFTIPQMIAQNMEGESLSLPSFVLLENDEKVVGTFARERGAEVPHRVVTSAKSWLCHSGIDRRAPILPIDEETRISPLQACAEFLSHLKNAWNAKFSAFNEQQILITVPASFDPSARQLVQEAAKLAGYPEIVLLEEPQAAFYAWIHSQEDWRKKLKVEDRILVVDIGGGTTDFSLIGVDQEKGDLVLNRIAVGQHLLLGGDNIDLALAYTAKAKLEEQGHAIDDWQLQGLVHACRQAKEKLLGEKPPKKVDVSVLGRGSKLIGGTLTTSLTKEDVQTLILDGFVPLVKLQEGSPEEKRGGIQQIGLPYAQDPRISAQLARFLSSANILPTAVLFNGGTLKSTALRQKIVEQLNLWCDKPVTVLEDADYDFAVSRGAVNYGLARQGKSIRIKGGTSCSYFIGVEEARLAIPGVPPKVKPICVVPFGMEEGSEATLEGQEFALTVGQQASFRFYSHSAKFEMGQTAQDVKELHPVETMLDQYEQEGKTVRVKLKSKVTELGVLELWCVADQGRQWKLEFDLRT